MQEETTITYPISKKTKKEFDRLCQERGLRKRWALEQAIIAYIEADRTK